MSEQTFIGVFANYQGGLGTQYLCDDFAEESETAAKDSLRHRYGQATAIVFCLPVEKVQELINSVALELPKPTHWVWGFSVRDHRMHPIDRYPDNDSEEVWEILQNKIKDLKDNPREPAISHFGEWTQLEWLESITHVFNFSELTELMVDLQLQIDGLNEVGES